MACLHFYKNCVVQHRHSGIELGDLSHSESNLHFASLNCKLHTVVVQEAGHTEAVRWVDAVDKEDSLAARFAVVSQQVRVRDLAGQNY